MVSRVGQSSGAPASAAAFQPTLPSGYTTGDRMLLFVNMKPATAAVPTINQGWVLLNTKTGGTGTEGADAGPVEWALYGKDATSASETAPTVTPGAPAPTSWEWIAATYRPTAGSEWRDQLTDDVPWVLGDTDTTTTGTALTATAGAFRAAVPSPGDAIVAFGGGTTDAATGLGATTITLSGLSGGTVTTTGGYVENALGNDSVAVMADWTGFTGSMSGTPSVAVSFTLTGTGNSSGAVVCATLREQPATHPTPHVSFPVTVCKYGSGSGVSTSGARQVTKTVPVGSLLLVVVGGGTMASGAYDVSDSQGHVWQTLGVLNGAHASSNSSQQIFWTYITTQLVGGTDTLTVTRPSNSSIAFVAVQIDGTAWTLRAASVDNDLGTTTVIDSPSTLVGKAGDLVLQVSTQNGANTWPTLIEDSFAWVDHQVSLVSNPRNTRIIARMVDSDDSTIDPSILTNVTQNWISSAIVLEPLVTGAASIALSATGTAASGAVPASGTGTVTLAASGTARGVATASGSLNMSASMTAKAVATATATVTISATASATVSAIGSASLVLSGSGTARAPTSGTASLTLTATASAGAAIAANPSLLDSDDSEAGVTNWTSSTGLGVYTLATNRVQSTDQAHSGTKSLKVTWPALSAGQRSWVNRASWAGGSVAGKTYLMTVWVYVPSGNPDVYADLLFLKQTGQNYSTKDAWFQISHVFTATSNTAAFFGVGIYGPTNGTEVAYIDDLQIQEINGAGLLIAASVAGAGVAIGSAALALSASGVAAARATGSASITLSSSSAAAAVASANASLTLSATATPRGVATGTASITFAGAAQWYIAGNAATLTMAGSGAARAPTGGTATITFATSEWNLLEYLKHDFHLVNPGGYAAVGSWRVTTGGAQQLELDAVPGQNFYYAQIATTLQGSSGTFQFIQYPNVSDGTVYAGLELWRFWNSNWVYALYWWNGTLTFREKINGAYSDTNIAAPAAPVWARIRMEADGSQVYWEYSADGVNWTIGRQKVPDAAMVGDGKWFLPLFIATNYSGTAPSPGTAIFDNFNLPPTPTSADGTASITLAASGSAVGAAAGSASLSFGATGATRATAVGSASVALSAAGTARGSAAGSASVALSASGTAKAASTGAASLTLSAAGTPRGVAAGAAAMTMAATGQWYVGGSGSVTLAAVGATAAASGGSAALTFSAVGQWYSAGTASMTLSASGATSAVATGTASLTLSATGTTKAATTGTAQLVMSGSGAARAPTTGSATLTFTATGATAATAGGSGSIVFAGISSSGINANGTGDLTLAASGTTKAAATGAASITLAAAGAAKVPSGGSASLTLAASGATGTSAAGTASVAFAVTGATKASATGTASLALSASGIAKGVTTGSASLALSAVGAAAPPSNGSASLALSASGSAAARATSVAALTFAATGATKAPATGTASVTLSGTATTAARASGTAAITLSAINYAPTEYVVHDFSTVNPGGIWTSTPQGSATVSVTGGQLRMGAGDGLSNAVGYYATTAPGQHSIAGSYVYAQSVQLPNASNGSTYTFIGWWKDQAVGLNLFGWVWATWAGGNRWIARERVGGAYSDVGIVTTDTWFRVRMDADGSTIYWDSSPDGIDWTTRRSKAPGFANPTGLGQIVFQTGNYSAAPNPGTAIWDNLNVPVATGGASLSLSASAAAWGTAAGSAALALAAAADGAAAVAGVANLSLHATTGTLIAHVGGAEVVIFAIEMMPSFDGTAFLALQGLVDGLTAGVAGGTAEIVFEGELNVNEPDVRLVGYHIGGGVLLPVRLLGVHDGHGGFTEVRIRTVT